MTLTTMTVLCPVCQKDGDCRPATRLCAMASKGAFPVWIMVCTEHAPENAGSSFRVPRGFVKVVTP